MVTDSSTPVEDVAVEIVEPLALLESVLAKPDMMRALRTLGALDDILKLRAALGGSTTRPMFSTIYVDVFSFRHEEGCSQATVMFERGRCEVCAAVAESVPTRHIVLVDGEPGEPMEPDMLIADSRSPLQQSLRSLYPSWPLWRGPLVTLIVAAIPEESLRG